MYRSFLAVTICILILAPTETIGIVFEYQCFLSDSTLVYKEGNILKTESETNNLAEKSILNLFADIQTENQTVIYRSQKSAWLAFGFSVIYPGLGQLYNGEYGKAFLMAGLATLVLAAFYYGASSTDFDRESGNDAAGAIALTGVIVGGATYVWSLIDAPISANKINRNEETNDDSNIHYYKPNNWTEQTALVINFRLPLNFSDN